MKIAAKTTSKTVIKHTTLGVGLILGIVVAAITVAHAQPAKTQTQRSISLRTFDAVLVQIKTKYVTKVDECTLINAAIHGMLSELDKYSMYVSSTVVTCLQKYTKTRTGILIDILNNPRRVLVTSVAKGSTADSIDIHSGDYIQKINGKNVHHMTYDEVYCKLYTINTNNKKYVQLTVYQPEKKKTITVDLYRSQDIPVVVKTITPTIGYIKLRYFSRKSYEATKQQLKKLSKHKIRGLILDLRNNDGGHLDAAWDTVNLFLQHGILAHILAMHTRKILVAQGSSFYRHTPLIVLVNHESKSAAELVAAALQENKRAQIVGTRTFGKGTVQAIHHLKNGATLILTEAHWRTPLYHQVNGVGIKPDFYVKNPEKQVQKAIMLLTKKGTKKE